jgi:imidazoleglycerol-phosphate dehydratase/histidinol-phosphatase
MLEPYMKGDYDLSGSWVIGDRLTDIEMAANLGAKGILIGDQDAEEELEKAGLIEHCDLVARDWQEIYLFLLRQERRARIERKTSETNVVIDLSLDGQGQAQISTGIGFFDHMLAQIARHGGMDLVISVKGDLDVDEHHTIEDTGLALGEAFTGALGDRKGIERFAFVLPMDDAEAHVSIDMGGRSWLVWDAEFSRELIGEMPTEMIEHFFKSFTDTAKCNLNIRVEGKNEHHKVEAIFKAFARTLGQAVRRDPGKTEIPSTKGSL